MNIINYKHTVYGTSCLIVNPTIQSSNFELFDEKLNENFWESSKCENSKYESLTYETAKYGSSKYESSKY